MVWKLAKEAQVADRVRVVGDPLIEIKSAMAVRKDNVELLALLDLAVGEFVASPDYRRIYVAWFGEPSPFWTLNRKPTVSPLFIPAHSASRNLA